MMNSKNEEILNYLVNNKIYPMYSKKCKIFFKKRKNISLSEEKINEIIDKLDLKNSDDCRKIRDIVK